MAVLQRYISKELTHFVGSELVNEEEQYHLLIKIIKEGCLKGKGVRNDSYPDSLVVSYDVGTPQMSDNEVFNTDMVCFCDIPVEDLYIHMNKYSNFGLAFLKTYIVPKGANPIYYIANNSIIHTKNTRSSYFNELPENFDLFSMQLDIVLKSMKEAHQDVTSFEQSWKYLSTFLLLYIFSYIKCFDDSKTEDDSKNYYMEREWRLLGSLKFSINDIFRIILPKKYSERFRKDVGDFLAR